MKRFFTKRKLCESIFLFLGLFQGNFAFSQFSQKLISESWARAGGQGISYKNSTYTDASKNVYVAGATMSGNHSDILIQKFNKGGGLQWERTYAGAAGMNDAATSVFVDGSLNVYVAGTVVNSVVNDQDLIVLKYNSSGVLQWSYSYDGGSSLYKQDAGTSITGLMAGSRIFVTGTGGNNSTVYDFRTICLTSAGVVSWSQSYDYASLADVPKSIVVNGSNVTVVGASQDAGTPSHWEMATINYHYLTGAVVHTARSNSNTVAGIHEINDITVDPISGDTYLIGSLEVPSHGYDVAIYKLDASLNLVWEQYYDLHGMDDKGLGIKFFSNNLYFTGYSTKAGFGKETLLMKVSSSTGSVVWTKEISGENGMDDRGEQLVIDEANSYLYVAASVYDRSNVDFKLYCYDLSGHEIATASYNGVHNLNDSPQAIEIDLDKNIIVTGSEQTGPGSYITQTVKYTLFSRSYNYAYTGTKPTHLNGKVIVGFNPARMKPTALNSRKFQAGLLSEFIDSVTLSAIAVATGSDWSRFKTYKVFKGLTPADSISITRLGDPIKAVDFWTYLSIDIPAGWNVQTICSTLDQMAGYVRRSSPDILFDLYDAPTDLLYSTGQLGLYGNSTYPNADINAEDAWDLEVGDPGVKVAIVDAPINWKHEEFNDGEQNEPGPTQKIGGGYNYASMSGILNDQYLLYDHGTAVAGIVGARRNNHAPGNDANAQGIAGIAGGNGSNNFGVQLFSQGISNDGSLVNLETIATALHDSYSNSPSNPKNIGANLINASWGTTNNPTFIIGDEIEECWRNHCIFIAARGHFYSNESNYAVWPACFDDLQVINVMASGNDGEIKTEGVNGSGAWSSNYGMPGTNNTVGCPADIMAPGVSELVSTSTPFNNYSTFEGTSASAPHVTGVASLMYSQHSEAHGYPNKLTTEDVEKIMEKTATDVGTDVGFDWETGYGLIDAYRSVRQVSNPYYVKHLTSTPTMTQTTGLTITLYTSQYDDIPDGNTYTNCKKVAINWDVDATLPAGHEIIDWWELEASTNRGCFISGLSNVLGANYLSVNTLFDPIGGNHVHKTATTYTCFFSNDGINGFWYPMSPNSMKYYFSVHVKKNSNAGIEELENEHFVLFPNPSRQNITVQSKSSAQISGYEIVDATGRIVAKEINNYGHEFTVNVVPLTQGIYYCRVLSDTGIETIPFLKLQE